MQKGSLGVKSRGHCPTLCDAKALSTGLWAGIHLGKKLHTHAGEGPRTIQVRKKTPDNWPKVNNDP